MSSDGETPVAALLGDDVRAAVSAIELAHQEIAQSTPATRGDGDDPEHWQGILEANAAAVLAATEHVTLSPGFAVRYRFYERAEHELRVRPFVARESTDVAAVRATLEWHPPPDSVSPAQRLVPTRDVDLLYRHFSFVPSPLGVFHYWLTMQEVWASATWVHTRVIADEKHFAEIVGSGDWQLEQPLESHQPVVIQHSKGSHLALLLYSPLHRHSIALQRVEIRADNSIVFADPITVATGPRGYFA